MRLSWLKGAGLVLLAGLAGLMGCKSEPQAPPRTQDDRTIDTDEEFWQEVPVSKDGDAFMVQVVIRKFDNLKNAKEDAHEQAMRRACEMAVKDYLRDISKYDANADEINRQILNQNQKFVKSNTVVRTATSENGKQYGLVLKVLVNDQEIKNKLQDLGLIRQAIKDKRMIIAIYGGANVSKELIGDVGRSLAEYYNKQGYEAILWEDIQTDIAMERNVGEKATEDFINKFVENPEFAGNEDYQGTLAALRSRAHFVVGFNVIKVSTSGRTVNTGIKAFCKDLLQSRIFANHQEYGSRIMSSDADRDLAISESTYKAAEIASAKIVKETNDWLDKGEQLQTGKEYTFKFTGFTDDEVQLIDKNWRASFSSGGDGNMEGKSYVRTYTGDEKGSALCDKVDMMLKQAGLKAKKPMPNSSATTFEFKKQ